MRSALIFQAQKKSGLICGDGCSPLSRAVKGLIIVVTMKVIDGRTF